MMTREERRYLWYDSWCERWLCNNKRMTRMKQQAQDIATQSKSSQRKRNIGMQGRDNDDKRRRRNWWHDCWHETCQ